jgi:hypothetical protein
MDIHYDTKGAGKGCHLKVICSVIADGIKPSQLKCWRGFAYIVARVVDCNYQTSRMYVVLSCIYFILDYKNNSHQWSFTHMESVNRPHHWRVIMRNEDDTQEEIVLLLQGIITQKDLPPVTETSVYYSLIRSGSNHTS